MSDNTTSTPASTTTNIDAAFADSPAQDNSLAWDDDTPQGGSPEPKEKVTEPKKEEQEGKPKEPTKKEKRWLTAKINGKEEKVDEETLLRDYQKYRAATEKFEQASKAQKSVEQFMKALQEDPQAVLNNPHLPLDRKKLAEAWLYEEIQKELNEADPRDQKTKELEAEIAKYKQKEEEELTQKQEQEYQETVSKRKEELGNLFSEAMKASTLSKHPETAAATLREMALYYRAVKEQTGEAPTVEELASHVEKKYYKGLYELANTLEGEELVQFLGPQIIKKLRAYDLGQLTKGKQESFTKPKEDNSDDWGMMSKPSKGRKTISPADMKDQVRKQLLGK